MEDSALLEQPLKTRGDMHKMLRALQELVNARSVHGLDWYWVDRSGSSGEADYEDYVIEGYDVCTKDVITYLTETDT